MRVGVGVTDGVRVGVGVTEGVTEGVREGEGVTEGVLDGEIRGNLTTVSVLKYSSLNASKLHVPFQ